MAKKIDSKKDIVHVLEKGDAMYQKGLSIDCVIFGFHDGSLKTFKHYD